MRVTCFLPCRAGSQRIPRKNVRPFGPWEHGLVELKLAQLSRSRAIAEIVLSTNDPEISDFVGRLDIAKLRVHRRREALSGNDASTDDLVPHVLELVDAGHVLWTHVTSPFVGASLYDQLIDTYASALTRGFDSLMTTTEVRAFLWKEGVGPLTYDRSVERWPRTQTIEPVHEINSAAFIASTEIYRHHHDRIGDAPLLYPLDKLTSFDIDWPEDFAMAECLMEKRLVEI